MVRQSQELVKRLHKQTSSDDFETAKAAARKRSAKAKEVLSTKAAERADLISGMNGTHKTKNERRKKE